MPHPSQKLWLVETRTAQEPPKSFKLSGQPTPLYYQLHLLSKCFHWFFLATQFYPEPVTTTNFHPCTSNKCIERQDVEAVCGQFVHKAEQACPEDTFFSHTLFPLKRSMTFSLCMVLKQVIFGRCQEMLSIFGSCTDSYFFFFFLVPLFLSHALLHITYVTLGIPSVLFHAQQYS